MRQKKIFFLTFSCILLFICCAPVIRQAMMRNIDQEVSVNNYEQALNLITKAQSETPPLYDHKNAISLFLDQGLLEHYAGYYQASSQSLQNAERLIEEAYTKSISESVASYILNDNTKEYPGEDFEDLYLNVFNALNYYHQRNIEGALVEIRKLTISSGKLNLLARKYEESNAKARQKYEKELLLAENNPQTTKPIMQAVSFSNSALARYLSILFYQAERNPDAVRIEYEQLKNAFTSNQKLYPHPIPKTIQQLFTTTPGLARLDLLCFTSLSPVKEEKIFVQFLPFYQDPLLWYPQFKIPVLRGRGDRIDRIEVVVQNQQINLELLENIGTVVIDTFNARFSTIFLKTYLRTLAKNAAQDLATVMIAKKVEEKSELAQVGLLLGRFTAKIALDASENADIRMCRYLPNKAYIGSMELSPGIYDLTFNYYARSQKIYTEKKTNIQVRENALNLVQAFNLDLRMEETIE